MIPINIEPVNVKVSQALSERMTEMFEGIDRYNDLAVNADLYLKSHPESDTEEKEVSIRLNMPGKDIFISKQGADFSSAAQELHDALKVALRKHKDMHKNKHKTNPGKF